MSIFLKISSSGRLISRSISGISITIVAETMTELPENGSQSAISGQYRGIQNLIAEQERNRRQWIAGDVVDTIFRPRRTK